MEAQSTRAWRVIGVLGVTGVALGAFGAHGLKDQLATAGMVTVWTTAVFYHLLHTVALLGLQSAPLKRKKPVFLAWTVGILLFSGSLYLLALQGPKWLGPITPVGGLLLLLGWALLIFQPRPQTS